MRQTKAPEQSAEPLWVELRQQLANGPSSEDWNEVVELLGRWPKDSLELALDYTKEHLKTWPQELCQEPSKLTPLHPCYQILTETQKRLGVLRAFERHYDEHNIEEFGVFLHQSQMMYYHLSEWSSSYDAAADLEVGLCDFISEETAELTALSQRNLEWRDIGDDDVDRRKKLKGEKRQVTFRKEGLLWLPPFDEFRAVFLNEEAFEPDEEEDEGDWFYETWENGDVEYFSVGTGEFYRYVEKAKKLRK